MTQIRKEQISSTDSSTAVYAPAVLTDWNGDADPGDVNDALDQLAGRVDDLEGAGGGDANAIHDNESGEIHAITEETTPASTDEIIIESAANSYAKRRVQITNLPGGGDADAIHDNVGGEINAVAEKASPIGDDEILIEDSAASYAKKKVKITNLPGGADADAIHDNTSGEIHAITEKATPVDADEIVIEDSAASYAKKRVQIGNLPGGSSETDLVKLTFAVGTTTSGQDRQRTTGGSYTNIGAWIWILRPIKLSQVLWDIKKAATYTLTIKTPDSSATLWTFDDVVVAADDTADVVFTPPGAPLLMMPGIYYFLMTASGSVTWDDNNTDTSYALIFDYWGIMREFYNGSVDNNFSLPMKLVFYLGTYSIVDL
jgi:hypothetical protein